ncbi:hypothetical protein Sa4125_25100 [Aureimonas sp. SA4125]|uniref:hypothetical protein n=1 Tax=Aureimonas sp. SA4125 TaxID=2826993 RepID=UPI001CC64226|nr:hypothetical protein [Aureimonas sp. SA4125]BDA84968.1 hypothetical protein Sa4125_25100 [Aureimonas sp. SA4125]
MADILIKLSRSYDHGTEPFDAVVLREPKLKDRRDVGPLYEVQRGLVIWDDTALWAYVTRLQSKPTAPGALDLLDLADADAIEIAVKGFFTAASPLFTRPTSSSSGLDGTRDGSKS